MQIPCKYSQSFLIYPRNVASIAIEWLLMEGKHVNRSGNRNGVKDRDIYGHLMALTIQLTLLQLE